MMTPCLETGQRKGERNAGVHIEVRSNCREAPSSDFPRSAGVSEVFVLIIDLLSVTKFFSKLIIFHTLFLTTPCFHSQCLVTFGLALGPLEGPDSKKSVSWDYSILGKIYPRLVPLTKDRFSKGKGPKGTKCHSTPSPRSSVAHSTLHVLCQSR